MEGCELHLTKYANSISLKSKGENARALRTWIWSDWLWSDSTVLILALNFPNMGYECYTLEDNIWWLGTDTSDCLSLTVESMMFRQLLWIVNFQSELLPGTLVTLLCMSRAVCRRCSSPWSPPWFSFPPRAPPQFSGLPNFNLPLWISKLTTKFQHQQSWWWFEMLLRFLLCNSDAADAVKYELQKVWYWSSTVTYSDGDGRMGKQGNCDAQSKLPRPVAGRSWKI